MSETLTEFLEQPRLAAVFVDGASGSHFGPTMDPEYAKAFEKWIGGDLRGMNEHRMHMLYAQFVHLCENSRIELTEDIRDCEELVHAKSREHFSCKPHRLDEGVNVLTENYEVFQVPKDSPEPEEYHGSFTYHHGLRTVEWVAIPLVIDLESKRLVVYEYGLRD